MTDLTYQSRPLTFSLKETIIESNRQELLLIDELIEQMKTTPKRPPVNTPSWMLLLLKKEQILDSDITHESLDELINYLTSLNLDVLYELHNVTHEQIDFAEQDYAKNCDNFFYLEILRHQRPVISMVVCRFRSFRFANSFFHQKKSFDYDCKKNPEVLNCLFVLSRLDSLT